jgi:hypothetical protein
LFIIWTRGGGLLVAAGDLTLLPAGADAERERGQVEVVVSMWR